MITLADKVREVYRARHEHAKMTMGMIQREEYDRIQCQLDAARPSSELNRHFGQHRENVDNWRRSQTTHLIHALGHHEATNVINRLFVTGTNAYTKVTFYHRSIFEAFFNTEKTDVAEIIRLVRENTLADVYDVEDEYEAVMRYAVLNTYEDIGENVLNAGIDGEQNRELRDAIKEWLTFEEALNVLILIQYSQPFNQQARLATVDGLSIGDSATVMHAYTGGRGVLRYLIDEVREIIYSNAYDAAGEQENIPSLDEVFYNLIDVMYGHGVVEDQSVLYELGGEMESDDDVGREDKEDSVT